MTLSIATHYNASYAHPIKIWILVHDCCNAIERSERVGHCSPYAIVMNTNGCFIKIGTYLCSHSFIAMSPIAGSICIQPNYPWQNFEKLNIFGKNMLIGKLQWYVIGDDKILIVFSYYYNNLIVLYVSLMTIIILRNLHENTFFPFSHLLFVILHIYLPKINVCY